MRLHVFAGLQALQMQLLVLFEPPLPPPDPPKILTLLCFIVFCASRLFSGVSATAVNFVLG